MLRTIGLLSLSVIVIFMWTGVLCAADGTAVSLDLVRDGTATASIVVARQATKSARLAAAELQYHVQKISGATLPIVTDDQPIKGSRILVGESEATRALKLRGDDFQPQEYLIKFLPDSIVLMGRDKPDLGKFDYADAHTFPYGQFDEQGTCYAVYDFLERYCQVRWYLPTDLGLCCPSTKTLQVSGTEVRRAPAMKYRCTLITNPMPADFSGDWVKGPKPPEILPIREQLLYGFRHRLYGIMSYAVNHSLEGYYDRFWNKEDGKPRAIAKFESFHPEYFAQGYPGTPPQMCYTNPGLIQQVAQDARDYFAGKGLKPGAVAAGDYFAIVPMDNSSYCKCLKCRELVGDKHPAVRGAGGAFSNDAASNYLFGFINEVAKEVIKTHPQKRISAIAYASYSFPPTNVKLESNIAITMCLGMRNIHSPVMQELNREVIDAWTAESQDRPKSLWLYYCFPSMWGHLGDSFALDNFHCFPGYFAHSIVDQMKMYREKNIFGIFYEPSYIANGQQAFLLDQLEFYVTWKLADDPTLDGNALIDEFFERYYGSAARPMRMFYELVEQIYGNYNNYPVEYRTQQSHRHQTEEAAWKHLGTKFRMQMLGWLMEQAHAAAKTDIEKQRVALFDRGIWQQMQDGRNTYLQRTGVAVESDKSL